MILFILISLTLHFIFLGILKYISLYSIFVLKSSFKLNKALNSFNSLDNLSESFSSILLIFVLIFFIIFSLSKSSHFFY